MKQPSLARWSTHLRSLGRQVISDTREDYENFADELGHRRHIDRWVIAWHRRDTLTSGQIIPSVSEGDLDVRLWRSLTVSQPKTDLEDILRHQGDAPILPRRDDLALEVWTEIELASMHALWWHSRLTKSLDIASRLEAAIRWHLHHLQPDNATNHPWGLHVFLLYEGQNPGIGARLYAETLLSNCQVMLGRPDRLSALLLLDAAEAIDHHIESPKTSD